MKKQIFPIEIIENTAEYLTSKNRNKTFIIYNMILLFVILFVIFSFFISVDINIIASGVVKSPGERIVINSPYSTSIQKLSIKENMEVDKGDTLFVLNSSHIENEEVKLTSRLSEVKSYIRDLKKLSDITAETKQNLFLVTSVYQESYNYFLSKLLDLESKSKILYSNYKRQKKLLKYGDIAASAFERIELEYNNSINAINLHYKQSTNEWQIVLDKYIVERRDLITQLNLCAIKKNELVVLSPVKGIVQKIEGIDTGSQVQIGQKILELSPDSVLLVECLVSPKDIGYLRLGQNVKMQVDAFNYNEWGLAKGLVSEIFKDIYLINTPKGTMSFFKVLVDIKTPYLELTNGYKGCIKRGMGVNARIKVTRRTLFQLLYDKVDNWTNPNIRTKQT